MSQLDDSAATAPEESYEESYEEPLPLSAWAVVASIVSVVALAALPLRNVAFFIGLVAVIAANAARHDIKRGLKSGGNWATTAIWIGSLAMVFVVAINLIDNFTS